MNIKVDCYPKGCIASLEAEGKSIYVSKEHPRAGCAVREVMLHMQILLGKPTKKVSLQVLEWE